MFSWQHFVWLGICFVGIVSSILFYNKKKPNFDKVIYICMLLSFLSEIVKVFSTIEMVPSQDGSIIYPYIPTNHLPLHLCSIQILFIVFVNYTNNQKLKENVLAFMYPSCLLGALSALLMPSIFSGTITVDQAFSSPLAYQFFIYHSMLIVLAIIIAKSDIVKWEWKHYFNCIKITLVLGFISLYLNSALASPTYLNGELQHVDFWPNFIFTYKNPLNIPITTIQGWYLYILIMISLMALLCFICFLPLLRKKK